MEPGQEAREILSRGRARLTPSQAGLPDFRGRRKVPGLRREEVALLAGLNLGRYVRLERGDLAGASDAVITAVSRALQLREPEAARLAELARVIPPAVPERTPRSPPPSLRPSVMRLLESLSDVPALVHDRRFQVLASNRLAQALYAPASFERHPNLARFVFLDPSAPDYFPRWERMAHQLVAGLGMAADRTPGDRRLTDLIGELATRSARFRDLWAAHDLRFHGHPLHVQHAEIGAVELTVDAFITPGAARTTLVTLTAEPGTPSAEALRLLAFWSRPGLTP